MEAATGNEWKKLPKMLEMPFAKSSWFASTWIWREYFYKIMCNIGPKAHINMADLAKMFYKVMCNIDPQGWRK
jgi:hypothetical protein